MKSRKRTVQPLWHNKSEGTKGTGRNKTRRKAREYKVYCRDQVLAGKATDSEGHWHDAKSLEGRNGLKSSSIRALQAGYHIPKHELY
jgi:hypothetical protein